MLWLVNTELTEATGESKWTNRHLNAWVPLERVPEEVLTQLTKMLSSAIFHSWQGNECSLFLHIDIAPGEPSRGPKIS